MPRLRRHPWGATAGFAVALAGLVCAGAARPVAAPAPAAAGTAAAPAQSAAPGSLATRNVILVTMDGLRIQELFAGMDPVVSRREKTSGIYDLKRARGLYWRDAPEERRRALMPFFWGTLAPQGVVLGNPAKGSRVTPLNPYLYSSPGYAEIVSGRVIPGLTSLEETRIPVETFLEYAQRRLGLGPREVAVFGSWIGFRDAAARRDDLFFINAGYEDIPADVATPRMRVLSDAQHDIMAPWETGRSDAVTMGLALDYLTTERPRLLWIALSETDDWAHARRYDRLLDCIHVYDGWLRRLWEAVGSMDEFRGRTTIVLTPDHGRGRSPRDWVEHGEGIAGSEDTWIAVIGPDTPQRGDVAAPPAHQAGIAATILRLLGLDPREWDSAAAPPIGSAFR